MDFFKKPAVVFNQIGIVHNYYGKPITKHL